jgi:mannose-6-phosphate isomerase-like protein (cupin superfamily)
VASAGDRFDMVDGSSYIVNVPSAEAGGAYVEMEFVLPAGCLPPPPHVHPGQVEFYEVLEGSLDVVVEGEWSKLAPSETAEVPVGAVHTFRNDSGELVRVRNRHTPALGFEDYIERVHATIRDAGIKSARDPRALMCISMVMFEYPETLVPARRRERIPMRIMAALGRLFRMPGSGR